MPNDETKNPTVEVERDDLLWAVNTLQMVGEDSEVVQRLRRIVDDSEPEGGRFAR